ncbi:MAG TPA: hypothetical protein VFA89_02195 [Terriglobales bacterium]|nr:hypothetical protein [Terriglobales bacterium]
MQTLGLSESTQRSEGRLKSLFWPSIRNGSDVDYLGAQGYWVCLLVAIGSLVILTLMSAPITAAATFLFYFVGGVGVRERSRYAAAAVFAMYFLDTLMGIGVLRIIFAALLLSNLRATWIAATWKAESEEAILPARLNESFADKLADQLPARLWPKLRMVYYIYSAGFLLLVVAGLIVLAEGTKIKN